MVSSFIESKDILSTGKRIYLRKPHMQDKYDFVSSLKKSKKFHYPWIINKINLSFYQGYLLRFEKNSEGHFVCCLKTNSILGVINVNDISPGPEKTGFLGFYAFVQHARKGYMSEGMQLVIERSFNSMRLQRLEANIQPSNVASKNFINRLGFQQQWHSRRFLRVAGRWKDHERWTLEKQDWEKENGKNPD